MKAIVKILVFYVSLSAYVVAQEKPSIKGKVVDASNGLPIEMVTIGIKNIDRWTTTNSEGEFTITGLPSGVYELCASYIGYEVHCKSIVLDGLLFELIELEKSTLAIQEVTVRAKESQGLGSVSDISMQTLEHIQPTDLSDALQLLPGELSKNPNLSNPNQLKIRDFESNSNPNSSLGTAVIIDGSQISNDANMQVLSTASSISGNVGSVYNSTATGGVDVRGISIDNIESIEVVRGIPSAEHGDLTSGAVIVKTKAGYTPINLKVKVDPQLKLFSVDKGLQLKNNGGAINLQTDYTEALNDLRYKYKSFNRITGNLGYSNTFFKKNYPMSFNVKFALSQNINAQKSDPDMRDIEDYSAEDLSFRTNVFGTWNLNKPWISNIKYAFSSSFEHQLTKIKEIESINGAQPLFQSYESGIFETIYLPSSYLSDLSIDGKPYNYSAKIVGNVNRKFGYVRNNLVIGADWRTNGNNGDGRLFDVTKPPNPLSNNSTRPRSFKSIPALNQLSFFAEDLLTVPLGKTLLEIQAGIRYTNLQPEGPFKSGLFTYIDPRSNFKWRLFANEKAAVFQQVSLKGGLGIATKSPTLLHFYPDNAYEDRVSFNYLDQVDNRMVVVSTTVNSDLSNPDLKPARNYKKELGLFLKLWQKKINVTAYQEHLKNGFSFNRVYDQFVYKRFDYLEAGLYPYFRDNGLFYLQDGVEKQIGSTNDTLYYDYSVPVNGIENVKKGIEYTIELGKINYLNTNVVVDGAYFHLKQQTSLDNLYQPTHYYAGKTTQLVGVYAKGEGKLYERFNTNVRTITHVPSLRLVVSLITQIVWKEKTQYIYEDENGVEIPYMNATDGLEGSIYNNVTDRKYIDPLAYYDAQGNLNTFNRELATEKPLVNLIKTVNNVRFYMAEDLPPVVQFNARITKEIGDFSTVSFFVNNIINYQPYHASDQVQNGYVQRNNSTYFGAEVKIKLNY